MIEIVFVLREILLARRLKVNNDVSSYNYLQTKKGQFMFLLWI